MLKISHVHPSFTILGEQQIYRESPLTLRQIAMFLFACWSPNCPALWPIMMYSNTFKHFECFPTCIKCFIVRFLNSHFIFLRVMVEGDILNLYFFVKCTEMKPGVLSFHLRCTVKVLLWWTSLHFACTRRFKITKMS